MCIANRALLASRYAEGIPSMRLHRYIFGRFSAAPVSDSKETFIIRGFRTGRRLEGDKHSWALFDGELIPPPSGLLQGPFFAGTLVKYRRESPSKSVDENLRQIKDEIIPNQVVAESPFFLHVPTGMIAYRPIPGQIEAATFRNTVAALFEEEYRELSVHAEIQSIESDYVFIDEIRSLDSISRICFELHPSNPSNRDLWKDEDERLRELDVNSYREDYKLKPGASAEKLASDKEIAAKSQMAADGYGRAKAVGRKGKREVVVSTSDKPVDTKVSATITERHGILDVLMEPFQSIASRFNKPK